MTVYILFGIYFEEKGLAATLGPEYVLYRQRTARVIPKLY
jgi:protein-S-isoprenylcysteine O-methyltransferase Ste14